MAEAQRGNMRPCGCHRGRPCTCEMGQMLLLAEFTCGECVNCLLNAKAVQKKRKPTRKCVHSDQLAAESLVDRLEIAPDCILRMPKPDWNVSEQSAFYTLMRQLRLGLLSHRIQSVTTIERQASLRKKCTRDLVKAQEALQRADESRFSPASIKRHRAKPNETYVYSDAFDAHSQQLILAQTLLPELQARIDAANHSIATEERNLQLVEAYVSGVAAKKLQQSVRAYQRAQRWRRAQRFFREDSEWAAAVVIQATFRMAQCKSVLSFLWTLREQKAKRLAADRVNRFLRRSWLARRVRTTQLHEDIETNARAQKAQGVKAMARVMVKIVCRTALWAWRAQRQRQRDATPHDERRTHAAVVLIQRHWRGLRERLSYQRTRYRHLLSDPVRALYDRFVCHGDLWRLLFEVDAAFRRHEHWEQEEQHDAKTFIAELVRSKRDYQDKMMHDWFTASAVKSPIVKGAQSLVSAFGLDETKPGGYSLAEAVVHSPMAADLKRLSKNQVDKSDVFPNDLPAKVIRLATYEGFTISETVTVMRGLLAQGKRADDPKTVLKLLKRRAPLMTNRWNPERVAHQHQGSPVKLVSEVSKPVVRTKSQAVKRKKPQPIASSQKRFVSENMLDNIPGGLKGPMDRLLLVAGLKCFNPDATPPGEREGRDKGAFVFRLDATMDPWGSYIDAPSLLIKIRREQVVQEAIRPHVQILKEKRCFSAFNLLRIARGIEEVISWGIPRPLVVSIYDVIELLHEQTVHLSERNIKRQMRVSAHFEAFVERYECEPSQAKTACLSPSSTGAPTVQNTPLDREQTMDAVAATIDRDVLELPVRDPDTPSFAVLFKAYFLLCGDSNGGHPDANQLQSLGLSKENYRRFLMEVVSSKHRGDEQRVRDVVQKRMKASEELANNCLSTLLKLGITCAREMKDLGSLDQANLPEVLARVVHDLVALIPDDVDADAQVGRLRPDVPSSRTKSPSSALTPLVRHREEAADGFDE